MATEYLDAEAVRASDATLRGLCSTGLHGLLPPRASVDAVTPVSRPDYERFLVSHLRFPPNAGFINWLGWYRSVSGVRNLRPLIEAMEALLDAGADPPERRSHVSAAAWEVCLAEEMATLAQPWTAAPDDAELVADPARIEAWQRARLPVIHRAVTAIAEAMDGSGYGAWRPQGVLGAFGYRTGVSARQDGIGPSARREVLKDVLFAPLPQQLSGWWGAPGSRQRIRRLQRILDVFRRLAGARRNGDWGQAIEDWDSDVSWLEGVSAGGLVGV